MILVRSRATADVLLVRCHDAIVYARVAVSVLALAKIYIYVGTAAVGTISVFLDMLEEGCGSSHSNVYCSLHRISDEQGPSD